MRRSYVAGWPATSKCSVAKRAAIASQIALTARMRRASGRASEPGRPNIRPGSGSRMVSTVAPAARSAPTVCASEAAIAAGSNVRRSVSLTPATTDTTASRSSSARGSCSCSTSRISAPLIARLGKSWLGIALASSAAQPRHVWSGIGSPMSRVIESPSAT